MKTRGPDFFSAVRQRCGIFLPRHGTIHAATARSIHVKFSKRSIFAVTAVTAALQPRLYRTADTKSYPPLKEGQFVLCQLQLYAGVLTKVSRKALIVSPCILFIFWSLAVVTNVVPFYTDVMEKVRHSSTPPHCFDEKGCCCL